ncbi:alpha/beta hydrolase [Candidatus Woesearchaeota archaeon]|jgi:predicted alpha/beta hydrolase family esterase|nr:alpha/beta hydrolase [Candidatus Woesearchaeota archaeon]
MKRAIIIHGWDGFPEEGWFPWLKKELEAKGFEVAVPAMPNAEEPEIDAWVGHLAEQVGTADSDTFLVGHSIGCQTVLRYLERLEEGVKVGGAVLVAGWMHLKPVVFEEEGAEDVARPWIDTPIDWEKIRSHCDRFLAVFSDDDPYVPLDDSKIFEEKLGARIIVEKGLQHMNGEAGVTELPSILGFFE